MQGLLVGEVPIAGIVPAVDTVAIGVAIAEVEVGSMVSVGRALAAEAARRAVTSFMTAGIWLVSRV